MKRPSAAVKILPARRAPADADEGGDGDANVVVRPRRSPRLSAKSGSIVAGIDAAVAAAVGRGAMMKPAPAMYLQTANEEKTEKTDTEVALSRRRTASSQSSVSSTVPTTTRTAPAVSGLLQRESTGTGETTTNSSKIRAVNNGKQRDVRHAKKRAVDTAAGDCGSTEEARWGELSPFLVLQEREYGPQDARTTVDRDEAQSALVREFRASRAAICSSNEHGDDALSLQEAHGPCTKQPRPLTKPARQNVGKTNRTRAAKSSSPSAVTTPVAAPVTVVHNSLKQQGFLHFGSMIQDGSVYELASHSVTLLLTVVHNRDTPVREFRRATGRLIHLLVEEALAMVPTRNVQVPQLSGNRALLYSGMCIESPLACVVVSMEQTSCPLLDTFYLLEPEYPSGYIRIHAAKNGTASAISDSNPQHTEIHILDAHLPTSLTHHNVFLLDLVPTSGALVCAAIHKLLEHSATECRITLVALFVVPDVLTAVQLHFPHVRVVTAEIDSHHRHPNEDHASRGTIFRQRYESTSI